MITEQTCISITFGYSGLFLDIFCGIWMSFVVFLYHLEYLDILCYIWICFPGQSTQGKDGYKLSYDPLSAQSERVAAQSTLFTLASFLEKQVPHCMSVSRILQAKCPLVKFRHHATGLSCDLTADNRCVKTGLTLT